jgi:peptidoglycan/xylan/chitin deacetylase (PgdA/CDA1 family)
MALWLKKIIKAILFYSGLLALYRFIFIRNSAVILMYHRISPRDQISPAEEYLNVVPETFEKQVRYLSRCYRVLLLTELVAMLRAGQRLPSRTCVITFDDGTKDNLETAFPILRKFGLPATFFLITSRADAPTNHYLNWKDVERLVSSGMGIGSHTHTHKALTTCPPDEIEAELRLSRERIVKEIRGSSISFAYPFGDFNELVLEEVRRSRYDCAVSTRAGLVDHDSDLFALPRVQIDQSSTASLPLFAARIVWPPRQS